MSASDRRRFFRIDDRLLLSIRRLSDEQTMPQSAGVLRGSARMLEIERRKEPSSETAGRPPAPVGGLGELQGRV